MDPPRSGSPRVQQFAVFVHIALCSHGGNVHSERDFFGFCWVGGFLHAPIVIVDHKSMLQGDDFVGFYENESQVQLSQCADRGY